MTKPERETDPWEVEFRRIAQDIYDESPSGTALVLTGGFALQELAKRLRWSDE